LNGPVETKNKTKKERAELYSDPKTLAQTLDYRCEDDRSQASASCVAISNADSISSCDTGINPGIRSRKCTELDVRKPLVVSISKSQELRLYNLVLGFDNSKPRLKSGIFKCISSLNCSFFGV
jgi:hypothetical protein